MLQLIKSKIKKTLMLLSGRYKHLRVIASADKRWYGNDYGGFFACPQLITESSVIYSIGIGEDISFDEAIIHEHHCVVFGFDPTPKSVNWVRQNAGHISEKFKFFDFGIAEKSGMADFYLPKRKDYVSGSMVTQKNVSEDEKIKVSMRSLKDIAAYLGHKKIDVLKLDIEGGEYLVLPNILNSGVEIDQILIEFHDRFFPDGRARTIGAIHELAAHGYFVFAVSDSLEEISFIHQRVMNRG